MDNVFRFRDELIAEYSAFSRSFVAIAASDIRQVVEREYARGRYWPQPLIRINPNYLRKGTVQDLAAEGVLHALCADIFRTGSGKSLSFFIPVVDAILKGKASDPKPRTRAIVIYPMNALANSQLEELDKFLVDFPSDSRPFTVARYTGQETTAQREQIANNPPDILLTNFMMLELILTRYEMVDGAAQRLAQDAGVTQQAASAALQANNRVLDEEKLAEQVFKALGFNNVDEVTLADHKRVREAACDVGQYSVTPCLPVDVIGVYVLLPDAL